MALTARQKEALNALLDEEEAETAETEKAKEGGEAPDDDDDHIVYKGRKYRPEKTEDEVKPAEKEKAAPPKRRRFVT